MKTKANIICTIVALISVIGGANAALQTTDESKQLLNHVVNEINVTMAAIAQAEQRAGNSTSDLQLTLDIPARVSPNLGLVLDLEHEQGFKVLSVTPGSVANNLGIKTNDVITAINNKPARGQSKSLAFGELENVVSNDTITFEIQNANNTQLVTTQVDGNYTPSVMLQIGANPAQEQASKTPIGSLNTDESEATEGACGVVTVFHTPPRTRELFTAFITQVNNNNIDTSRHTISLPVGKHTLYVHELINDAFLTRRSKGLQKAKTIEVNVQANTTYHIAAQFNRALRNKQRKGEYWEPVIWKEQTNKACSL